MKTKSIAIGIIAIIIIIGVIWYFSFTQDTENENQQENQESVQDNAQQSFETDDQVFEEIDLALQGVE